MDTPSESDDRGRRALSALMDGQAGADELASAFAAWRNDADARASWHAFHLIGDVMRSDELGARSRADEAFLQGLRERLAAEPVPLAPAAVAAGAPARQGRTSAWRRLAAPAAIAAGFVAVAGSVIVLRTAPVEPAPTTLASDTRSADDGQRVDAVAFIRDRHIDSYLEAHRQQSIRRAVLPEGAVMRRVDAVVDEAK